MEDDSESKYLEELLTQRVKRLNGIVSEINDFGINKTELTIRPGIIDAITLLANFLNIDEKRYIPLSLKRANRERKGMVWFMKPKTEILASLWYSSDGKWTFTPKKFEYIPLSAVIIDEYHKKSLKEKDLKAQAFVEYLGEIIYWRKMSEFKLTINDPKTGKSYNKVVTTDIFKRKKLHETVSGETIGLNGYELEVTGGSDTSGFPMRSNFEGIAKRKALLKGGVGVIIPREGARIRKTIRGNELSLNITQINLKITKYGPKKLEEIFGVKEEVKEEKKEGEK